MAAPFAQFIVPRLHTFRIAGKRSTFLLSSEEIATLWHPATENVQAERLAVTLSRQLEPPVVFSSRTGTGDMTTLGRVEFRDRDTTFGIGLDDRRRHLAITGKTGMGKTTLLENMIAGDIRQGRGVAVIDPHGDLAEAVLAMIPRCRTNDVVWFDAGDPQPIAFNLLRCDDPLRRPLVASGVVSAFKKLYADSWGPRLEHILRNTVLAALETPDASLVSVLRTLNDPAYRKRVVAKVTDPVVGDFWRREFSGWNDRYRAEAIAPIQNKLGQFLSHPITRAIVGQPESKLDLRSVMDNQQVLIVNLSKGRIGEDASMLLGSLLVTGLQLAAMSRADTAEQERSDFFAYVDEFQNFATESFATILSEARKYRLSLTIANQYLDQMDEATREAVFGNIGSMIAFQVGVTDAEVLAKQFDDGRIMPRDLANLPRFVAAVRLLIDGMPSRPFTMRTLPPPAPQPDRQSRETLRRTSRQRYSRRAEDVERQLASAFAV